MSEEQKARVCPCCKNKVYANEKICPYCGEDLSLYFERKNSITPVVVTVFAIMFVISVFIIVQKFQSFTNNNKNFDSKLKVSYVNKQKTEPEEQQRQEKLFVKYMDDLQKDIKRNWNPPRGDESKRVVLLFKLDKQGTLLSVKVVQSSGSKSADEAAISAVEKSAPFKPLPIDFTGDNVDIQFTFDYKVFGR